MNYRKILIAVDSSVHSMKAAEKGLELADQLKATVAMLYVIDTSKALGNFDTGFLPGEALLILKKEAEQTLEHLAKMFKAEEAIKLMPEGYPPETILKTAETWEADLIVMGTHGRTGLGHLLMGSVAEHVLHHARIPLLIVPLKK